MITFEEFVCVSELFSVICMLNTGERIRNSMEGLGYTVKNNH